MSRLRSTASVAALTLAVVALGACGQQTDERVEPADAAASAEIIDAAPAGAFATLDCVSLQGMPVDQPPADATNIEDAYAIIQPNGAPAITLSTSPIPAAALGVADIRVGDGAEVQPGDTVTVNYCGVGYGGQTVFDSSWSRGEPIAFPLDNLIPGWQEGIPGMRVGGQRLLVIPGELGYGENGAPGIAPNETLVFVIELLDTAS